jgi:hypothetical protein
MAHFAPGSKALGTTLSLTFRYAKRRDERAKAFRQRELLARTKSGRAPRETTGMTNI